MVRVLPQVPTISAGETESCAVDFTDRLDSGELLTGTPTVTEVTTADLTLGSKAVNTSALTMFGSTVAVGAAVQFTVSGQQASSLYTLSITVSTDATPARTFARYATFCVDD
jgi:hypothetical protein